MDLANIHRHTHHSSRRWSCGATWSDMKHTNATCHDYSWHAPFVSSNSMVVVTNGGHSRSGRHSSPRAPFCTVLGADRGWRPVLIARASQMPCSSWNATFIWSNSEVVAISRGHFCAWLPFSFVHGSPFLSLVSCPPASLWDDHATNSSVPLIHHLQALRTGSLGLVARDARGRCTRARGCERSS